MFFVVGVALMNAVATMLVIPVLPRLVAQFTGDTGRAAHYVGLFAMLFALTQLVMSPVLGSLSDRYGRRLVILTSALGQGSQFILMATAHNLAWLFVARIVSGVTAGNLPAINAFIADVVPAEKRAASFGWVSASTSAGFLLGPALGGLLGDIDIRLPFWTAAGLCLANFLYGAFVMPESLRKDRRATFSFAKVNPVGALRFLAQRPAVASFALVYVMLMLAAQCMPNTIVLYTDYRFGWSAGRIGAYLTAVGVANMLVQAFVLRRFVARFGERAAVIVGFTCHTVAFLIYASAPRGTVFVLAAPFFALGSLVTPAVQAQATRQVAENEQGRLQGAFAALLSLCGLIAPLVYTQIFAFAIGPGRDMLPAGSHMYLAAALLAVGGDLGAALPISAASSGGSCVARQCRWRGSPRAADARRRSCRALRTATRHIRATEARATRRAVATPPRAARRCSRGSARKRKGSRNR
jgi:DHA1 family tetracycline resistance protein-like MFS transporter